MARYLLETQLAPTLQVGKAVDQWLGAKTELEYNSIEWLRIKKSKGGFAVTYFESFDEGNEEFLDLYAFTMVNFDEPYGLVEILDTINDAIDFAEKTYGAKKDRFMLDGVIQQEYLDYVLNKQ